MSIGNVESCVPFFLFCLLPPLPEAAFFGDFEAHQISEGPHGLHVVAVEHQAVQQGQAFQFQNPGTGSGYVPLASGLTGGGVSKLASSGDGPNWKSDLTTSSHLVGLPE